MDIKSFLFLVVAILSVGLFAYLFKEKNEDAVFKQIRLFPRRFKFLGLFVILCSVILPWIFEGLLVDGSNYIGATYLNLGLSLICFSHDKTEDEMLNIIRLKSFYRSMGVGIFAFFILTYLEYSVATDFSPLSADVILALIWEVT